MKKIYIVLGCLLMSYHVAWAQFTADLLALTDVSIIDANHRVPLDHQTILIRQGKIQSVFKTGTQRIPDSAVVISLKGKFMLPGLVDSHVHLATDPSGVDNRAHTTEVLKRMLYSGITTVRDMAGDGRVLAGLSRETLLNEIPSPKIYYAALMAGTVFFSDPRTASSSAGAVAGTMPFMQAITDTTTLTVVVARAIGSGATGIKLYANLTPGLVDGILREAKKQHIKVWAHAWLQQSKPSDLISAGVNSLSHAPLLIREFYPSIPADWTKKHDAAFWDRTLPDYRDIFRSMKAGRVVLDATLLTYKKWAETDTMVRWDYELGKRITAQAYKAGVIICAGTDTDQEQFVQEEMRLLVSDAGFLPVDAIIAGTQNGAIALGLETQIGTVSKGKAADLLILNYNPLLTMDNISSVYMVLKDGGMYRK